jgi:hypothetical protein
MPITLFDTATQKPLVFDTGSSAKDALLGGGANFSPDQDVYLKSGDGSIVKAKGKDATGYVLTPGSEYSLASDEDVISYNRAAKFDNPVQQGMAAVEGAINSATLGLGNAMTRVGVELVTPRGSEAGKKYGQAVKERAAENPMSSLAGEVTGIIADPLGAVGMLEKGAQKVASKVVAKGTAAASKAPGIVQKVAEAPLVQKIATRGIEFGAEGAAAGGSFEAGRQLTDGGPINPDAILSEMKDGSLFGGGIGVGFGATEYAAKSAYKGLKTQIKKNLDKIVGAPPEKAGEAIYETSTRGLKKELNPKYGRAQKGIKIQEEADGVYKYSDDRKEGFVSGLSKDANGLDLTDSAQIEKLGSDLGVSDLGRKYKTEKEAGETLENFISRAKQEQNIEARLGAAKPYMSPEDAASAEQISMFKERYRNLESVQDIDREMYEAIKKKENALNEKYFGLKETPPGPKTKKIVKGYEESDYYGTKIKGEPIIEEVENFEETFRAKRAEYQASERADKLARENEELVRKTKAKLSEYDYIRDMDEAGKKYIHVFNENILPPNVTVKNLGKGITPLDFEAGQMAKQFKMTPSKMQKLGNARLNEVAEFILDRYPTEGSILKKVTTSADFILDEINTIKNKSINELNDTVEQALNLAGSRQRITTEDIAQYVENSILPRYVDELSGNPIAGLEKEYKQIKEFADGYRNNGYVADKYGRQQKVYKPLDVKEIRDLRIKLDKVAKYNSAEINALKDAARELRTWVEDAVVSKISEVDGELVKRYNIAKKQYGLSIDAEKIVDVAAKKAAKDSKFSLFYSGVGAAVGGSLGGAPGAIVGTMLGGAARNVINEFSGALSVFLSRNLGKNVERYEKLIDNTAKAFFKPIDKSARVYTILPKDTDSEILKKDYERFMGEISDRANFMESFVDNNQELFSAYPETSEKLLNKALLARDFLVSKIPKNPYIGNPFRENEWTPSPYEFTKYLRYREAVQNPSTILKQIRDGYVTPEAIEVLENVYPETKQALFEKLVEQASKIKNLPVEKRVEIFKIFGIQMDSFMTGKNFMELQQDANGQAQQSALQQNGGNFKPQNASKMAEKDSTLGNSTLR